ncbi:helix-turn-helix domain-containing protein [Streptococcus dysgalactiae]|uniref:helix-turn-helix domain-containing protein n=1 Tax=Streptococcus dysgalactiae TaxID=1334 RepID=UPI001FA9FAFF|nr:helix-turn-helix transcriptional regulator [Streptococcus dysgalactiae]
MNIKLKQLRQQRELSLSDLSGILKEEYKLKVSPSQLNYFEKGIRNLRNDKIPEALADYFNVPVPYLLGYMSEESVKSLKVISEVSKPLRKTIANISNNMKPINDIFASLNQQLEELSTFALENDLSETIKEKYGSEEILKIYSDLKELSFMVRYKAQKIGLSEEEIKEIDYFDREMLAFIDALMEVRIELNNAARN